MSRVLIRGDGQPGGRPVGGATPQGGGKWAGPPRMLQQVSQPAPSAPPDRGPLAGDAPGAAPEAAGQDFLALLAQAQAQDGSPPAGLDGLDPADGLVATGEMAGEAAASPAAALPPGPVPGPEAMAGLAQPVLAGAPQPVAGVFAPPAQGGGAAPDSDPAMPVPRRAPVAQAQPGTASEDQPAIRRASGPHADAAPEAGPRDAPQDVSGAAAEEPGAAAAFKPDSPPAPSSAPISSPILSPSLAEWRGLSMPPNPIMAGAGALPGQGGLGQASPPVTTGAALPYQHLLPPRLAAQVAPAVLAMGFLPGTDGGPARLTVAIRPAELGTLQIVTERTEDGPARIAVLAERAETLQLLVRDASSLETALREAGVDTGGGLSLTFGLASQGRGDRGAEARDGSGRPAGRGDGADPPALPVIPAAAMARTSLLDLSI